MYVLQIVVCPFVLFLLVIVLAVLLRYTDSDYTFGIFKLFLLNYVINVNTSCAIIVVIILAVRIFYTNGCC